MVSAKPRAARRRLRAGGQTDEAMRRDIEMVYQKPLEQWDWEELSKGMPRNADGTFPRKRPTWITPSILGEAQRRMRELTEQQLMVHAQEAIATLSQLMKNQDEDDWGKPVVPASVKADAAKYILNHVIGLPKARVDVSTHNPLEELMGGILVNPNGLPSHQIIEGEIVEDEEDDGGE